PLAVPTPTAPHAPPPRPDAPLPAPPRIDMEQLVGGVWLQNIGAMLLLVAIFFLIFFPRAPCSAISASSMPWCSCSRPGRGGPVWHSPRSCFAVGWVRRAPFVRWMRLALVGVTVLKFLLVDLPTPTHSGASSRR